MIAEEFWIDSTPAYCSTCGFGSQDGIRLNGNLESPLAICSGCLSKYYDPADRGTDWKLIPEDRFKELCLQFKTVSV